jgi:hypothetical protein
VATLVPRPDQAGAAHLFVGCEFTAASGRLGAGNRRGKIAARELDHSPGDVILIVGRRRAASTVNQLKA